MEYSTKTDVQMQEFHTHACNFGFSARQAGKKKYWQQLTRATEGLPSSSAAKHCTTGHLATPIESTERQGQTDKNSPPTTVDFTLLNKKKQAPDQEVAGAIRAILQPNDYEEPRQQEVWIYPSHHHSRWKKPTQAQKRHNSQKWPAS